MNKKKLKICKGLAWMALLVLMANYCVVEGKAQTFDSVNLSPQQEKVYIFDIHDGDTLTFTISVSSGQLTVILWESSQYFKSGGYYEDYWSDVTSGVYEEFTPWWTDTFYLEISNPSTISLAI